MTKLREIGREGLSAFYGNVSETYVSRLEWPGAYSIYDEMRRREPTLRAILNAIKLLARQAKWNVETASDKPADKAAGEFLESCLLDTSHTVGDFVDDVLTFLPFGWSSCEICYKRRDGMQGKHSSKFDDGRVGWRKLAFRRQSSFTRWEFDDTGGLAGWYQRAAPSYKETLLPIGKLIHFTAERDGGNPEGLALFESAYEPYHFVTNLQIVCGIGWQRTFVGLPVFEFEERPADGDVATVKEVGEALTVDEKQYVSVPPSVKFRLESTGNAGASSLLDTIRHFRILMTQMVLADFIFLGAGDTGSWSLGRDKSLLFLMAVNGFLDRIAEPWNRFGVERLFRYNEFPGLTEIPRIVHSEVRKPDLAELGAFIQAIGQLIPFSTDDENWIRQQAGMPEKAEEEIEETPKPAPQTGEEETPEGDEFAEFAEAGGRDGERKGLEATLRRGLQSFLREQQRRIVGIAETGLNPADDADFWKGEQEQFKKSFLQRLQSLVGDLTGMAIDDLAETVGGGVDWALVNTDASRWARKYAGGLVKGITATTRRGVKEAVTTWIETGAKLPDLTKSLTPIFGPKRAELIAVTEVTKAYDEANDLVRQQAGLPATAFKAPAHPRCRCFSRPALLPNGEWVVVWQTVRDDRVCKQPLDTPWGRVNGCRDLHKVIVSEGPYLGKELRKVKDELKGGPSATVVKPAEAQPAPQFTDRAEAKKWLNENKALNPQMTPSENEAMEWYKGEGYFDINEEYRAAGYSTDERGDYIEVAIDKSVIEQPMTVYRGASWDVFDEEDLAGSVIEDGAFVSTSMVESTAMAHADGVILEIHIPAGAKGLNMEKWDVTGWAEGEAEILLQHGSKFRVISDNIDDGPDIRRIVLELVT